MDGCTCSGPTRRGFLYIGAVGGLGLTLGDAFALASPARAKADSVIHIFLPGGIAAQESFDPKRFAPEEYRGPLRAIPTKLDGVFFSELFANTAAVADKLTIVRAMSHSEAAHERGTHNMFTGYRPSPAIQYPSMGSVVGHELGGQNDLPPYVCVPTQPNSYAGSGYLSTAYGPFSLGDDPSQRTFRVRDLSLPRDVDAGRFARRRDMLEAVDDHFRELEKADELDAMDAFYQRAYALISSKQAREAFNLNAEKGKLRDAYGRNPAGQRMLMARRLVEAGVRFVSLTVGGWDHHDDINGGVRREIPPLDQAFAALVGDLESRGMLERTLVMLTTEFGRTPKVNGTGGRDHYPKVFSIVLAGGGVKRGHVHGESDSTSTEPESDALSVPDWAMTMYHLIGIDGSKELVAPGDRPIEIVKDGRVVKELLA